MHGERDSCCEDKKTSKRMALLARLREAEATIPVPHVRYRERGASIAQTSRLRMVLRKAKRERDAVANEVRGLCRG